MIFLVFLLGILIRFLSIYSSNIIIGFDQARDLFDAFKIIQGDLRIIGPTAGNNVNLHHGVAFLYTLIPPLFLGHNPLFPSLWLAFINALSIIVLYFFAKDIFKSKRAGLIAAFLAAISYYLVSYSGWISNPGPTLFTVPVFFYAFWKYKTGKKWFLPGVAFFLGLTIQYELFFLYLIPTIVVLFLILRIRFPDIKVLLASLISFCLITSTMIATELKYSFSGVISLFSAGQFVGGEKQNYLVQFIQRFFETFGQALTPQLPALGILIALFVIGLILAKPKNNLLFLLIYLFSPALMLFLGYHNAPWFLIGLPPVIILCTAYALDKIKSNFLLIAVLLLLFILNTKGPDLLEPDKAANLKSQIAAMEYTYKVSEGKPFAINTVTNPLYINAIWAWNYDWYSKNYGYKPTWIGGDQLPPYDTLQKSEAEDQYLFLIIDKTNRIPPQYTIEAEASVKKIGDFIKEQEFGGILVQVYKNRK